MFFESRNFKLVKSNSPPRLLSSASFSSNCQQWLVLSTEDYSSDSRTAVKSRSSDYWPWEVGVIIDSPWIWQILTIYTFKMTFERSCGNSDLSYRYSLPKICNQISLIPSAYLCTPEVTCCFILRLSHSLQILACSQHSLQYTIFCKVGLFKTFYVCRMSHISFSKFGFEIWVNLSFQLITLLVITVNLPFF